MTMYTIHVWAHDGIGREIASRKTYRAAKRYAEAHATEYDGGLYIRRPDGLIDTGRHLVSADAKTVTAEL
jgi:hypothetical protein